MAKTIYLSKLLRLTLTRKGRAVAKHPSLREGAVEAVKAEPVETVTVEKASKRKGIIIFKALAVDPGIEDADGEIVDSESAEESFWDFLLDPPAEPVDFDHKEALKGRIVSGWYFPDEQVFRVAFKPDDPDVVELALKGELTGSSFWASLKDERATKATPESDEPQGLRRYRRNWQ